jgi:hypothetical protein
MRAMNSSPSVSIGPSSILGWLAAAAGFVTSVVLSLEHSSALVSGPSKWPAILGVVSLAATNAGRQFQAAHLTKAAAIAGDVAQLPAALQALAAEAQKNVAIAQANPDGVDGPEVAFSGGGAPVSAAATPQG